MDLLIPFWLFNPQLTFVENERRALVAEAMISILGRCAHSDCLTAVEISQVKIRDGSLELRGALGRR